MRGGKKMRKLNKINFGRFDTIEAYACVCSCNCANACSGCGCAVSSAEVQRVIPLTLVRNPALIQAADQMVTESNFM